MNTALKIYKKGGDAIDCVNRCSSWKLYKTTHYQKEIDMTDTNKYANAINAILDTLDPNTTNIIHEYVEADDFSNVDEAAAQLKAVYETYYTTSTQKIKRKEQILTELRENGDTTMQDMAAKFGISRRNVSSQLTYLRRDGHVIDVLTRGKDKVIHLSE